MAPSAASGGVFGTLSTGSDVSISDGDSFPSVFVVGKLGYDAVDSPWGWQVDGTLDHSELGWVRPKITDQSGDTTEIGGGLHLTYRPDSTSKLGLFVGYSSAEEQAKAKNGGTFTFRGLAGTVEGETSRRRGMLGIEGLQFLDDSTWLQARIALVDPLYARFEATDGVTTIQSSKRDFLGDIVGGTVGVSLHHDFSTNLYAHVFADAQRMTFKGDSDTTRFDFGVGTKYTFDAVPLSLFTGAGVSTFTDDGDTETSYGVSSGITWRFGQPESSSNARLFRSAN